jgi:hypothetical protein
MSGYLIERQSLALCGTRQNIQGMRHNQTMAVGRVMHLAAQLPRPAISVARRGRWNHHAALVFEICEIVREKQIGFSCESYGENCGILAVLECKQDIAAVKQEIGIKRIRPVLDHIEKCLRGIGCYRGVSPQSDKDGLECLFRPVPAAEAARYKPTTCGSGIRLSKPSRRHQRS